MLTSEQLKQIRWHSNGCATVAGDGPWGAVCDACALREAVPALLDTVAELSQQNTRLRSLLLSDTESMTAVFRILRANALGDHSSEAVAQLLADKVEALRDLLKRAVPYIRIHEEQAMYHWLSEAKEALQ